MKQFRQGDVLAIEEALPPKAVEEKTEGDVILAHGEVTGHAHRIPHRSASTYRDEVTDRRYLKVSGGGSVVVLKHEEHAPIIIKPKTYRVKIARVWTDEQESTNVTD